MCRVGMCFCAALRMQVVKFCAAVEGSSESKFAQLVAWKVELSEVQSAFLKSYASLAVDVSCGVGKLSVVSVALWSAI